MHFVDTIQAISCSLKEMSKWLDIWLKKKTSKFLLDSLYDSNTTRYKHNQKNFDAIKVSSEKIIKQVA